MARKFTDLNFPDDCCIKITQYVGDEISIISRVRYLERRKFDEIRVNLSLDMAEDLANQLLRVVRRARKPKTGNLEN